MATEDLGNSSFSDVFSAPQPLSQVTNVIMSNMFATQTATNCFTGLLLLPQTPTDSPVSSFIIVLSITRTEIVDKQSIECLCCQSVTQFQITLCSHGSALVAEHIAASFSRHHRSISAFSFRTDSTFAFPTGVGLGEAGFGAWRM